MPIEVSIVIVNYNVKAFLQQCLFSVKKACKDIDSEIFVVDNNSVDDSIDMIKENFPDVNLIANKKNTGFAFACNQAIRLAAGKYILLLNPDTVVREDSILHCIDFMDKTPDAGALGVKMINGKGKFLPESKRSLPTAKSAFFKMFGLSSIFPKSKLFGKYQLIYLDENKTHEVEVLSGAFMFIRKSVLDKTGLLDEAFFMYGEDIDLSYRILKAGYKNYYFPITTIIHYKGESTKKASFKYVKTFYNAMLIFANKHYKGKKQFLFRLIIRIAIYLRAFISILKRLFSAIYLPAIDFTLIYLAYYFIVPLWEQYKFSQTNIYHKNLMTIYVPLYIFIWQITIFYFTRYKLKAQFSKLIKAVLFGTIIILVIYSLLPEEYRYSRILIIFGAFQTIAIVLLSRILIKLATRKGRVITWSEKKRALLIKHDKNKLSQEHQNALDKHFDVCKQIGYAKNELQTQDYINKLEEYIEIYKIETLVFFIKDLSAGEVINSIIKTAHKSLEFKIVLPESGSMVGDKSVIDLDKMPHLNINPITKPINKLKKRTFDIVFSLVLIIFSPLFLLKNKAGLFYKTVWKVLANRMTWVSFGPEQDKSLQGLPVLKPGVFKINIISSKNKNNVSDFNQNYAKDYRVVKDIIAIFKALKLSINLMEHIKN